MYVTDNSPLSPRLTCGAGEWTKSSIQALAKRVFGQPSYQLHVNDSEGMNRIADMSRQLDIDDRNEQHREAGNEGVPYPDDKKEQVSADSV